MYSILFSFNKYTVGCSFLITEQQTTFRTSLYVVVFKPVNTAFTFQRLASPLLNTISDFQSWSDESVNNICTEKRRIFMFIFVWKVKCIFFHFTGYPTSIERRHCVIFSLGHPGEIIKWNVGRDKCLNRLFVISKCIKCKYSFLNISIKHY